MPGQFQGCHKARRPQADHHRAALELFCPQYSRRFWFFFPQGHLGIPEKLLEYRRGYLYFRPDMANQTDIAFPPGVHGLPDQDHLPEGFFRQTVFPTDDLFQRVMAVQPYPQVIDSDFHRLYWHPAVPFLSAK